MKLFIMKEIYFNLIHFAISYKIEYDSKIKHSLDQPKLIILVSFTSLSLSHNFRLISYQVMDHVMAVSPRHAQTTPVTGEYCVRIPQAGPSVGPALMDLQA